MTDEKAHLQRRLYDGEKLAGWDPDDKNSLAEEISHLHEEISEAFRAWRKTKSCILTVDEAGKPQGVPAELADAVIGMFYIAERWGFDLLEAVERKHAFNLTRSYAAEGRRLHEHPHAISEVADEKAQLAASLIAAERQRQINVEGYTSEHDAEHGRRVLSLAAGAYRVAEWGARTSAQLWPWSEDSFKPRDRVSNLIRAGALYMAALDLPGPDSGSCWANERTDYIERTLASVVDELASILNAAQRLLPPGGGDRG